MRTINELPPPINPVAKFTADFKEWRETRAEHAQLCKAIRAEKPRAEIAALAAAAGLNGNELSDLLCLRARAVNAVALADGFPAAEKELARLDKAIAAAEKALEAANPLQQEAAAAELVDAHEMRRRHWCGVFLPAQQATTTLAVAKEHGVF